MSRNSKQIAWLKQEIADQKKWIEDHGGTLASYIERYGSKNDADHYGDGGEAIFKADTDHLKGLELQLSKIPEPKPITEKTFWEKVNDGDFKNDIPFAAHGRPGRTEYLQGEHARENQFKTELFAEYGMTNHPKAEKCYNLAWENGHAHGFSEVAVHFAEYAELVKD